MELHSQKFQTIAQARTLISFQTAYAQSALQLLKLVHSYFQKDKLVAYVVAINAIGTSDNSN